MLCMLCWFGCAAWIEDELAAVSVCGAQLHWGRVALAGPAAAAAVIKPTPTARLSTYATITHPQKVHDPHRGRPQGLPRAAVQRQPDGRGGGRRRAPLRRVGGPLPQALLPLRARGGRLAGGWRGGRGGWLGGAFCQFGSPTTSTEGCPWGLVGHTALIHLSTQAGQPIYTRPNQPNPTTQLPNPTQHNPPQVKEDSFTTMSGRKVALRIYTQPQYIDQVDFAMVSLIKSMKWDEEVFGLEYDLVRFTCII
jgi:hypothetical protein